MNGPQNDLQGYAGFDPIPGKCQPEDQIWPEWPVLSSRGGAEPTPDDRWEADMNGIFALLTSASSFLSEPVNLDQQRWYRETMHPRDYMNMSYYELWVVSTCIYFDSLGEESPITRKDLCEHAIISAEQLDLAREIIERGRTQAVPGFGRPDENGRFSSSVYSTTRGTRPTLKVGDRVRTALQSSSGHTRQYGYLRGREGVVVAVYPAAPPDPEKGTGQGLYERGYPDTASRGGDQDFYVPLYKVRFEAADLFGADFVESASGDEAEGNTVIFADLWETYLELVSQRPVAIRPAR